jgi:hypothetical protein
MLNDYQLAQGMRRLVYSGKTHPPTLPEFVKLCRTVGHADDVPDQRSQLPTSRALAGPDDEFDGWAIAANFRLLGYILRKGVAQVYFDPRETGILVAFKNRWADLMRASGSREEVPVADQDAAWIQGMRMTEAEMKRKSAA